jgi:hypothetical protein
MSDRISIKINRAETRILITRYPRQLGPGDCRRYYFPTPSSVARLRRLLGARLTEVMTGPAQGCWEARLPWADEAETTDTSGALAAFTPLGLLRWMDEGMKD